MSFLDVLLNFLSFICVTEFSYHFHVVHIAVMCKTYSYQKWNMVFFLFFSISKPKVYSPIPCFFRLCSISHAFANPLRFISPMQHSHIHTVFKHYHEQDAMIEKQNLYNVTTDWWKLVKKSRMKWKKMSCAVTYNGEGMVEAGIGSEKFLRIRILETLKETPFFGPSS